MFAQQTAVRIPTWTGNEQTIVGRIVHRFPDPVDDGGQVEAGNRQKHLNSVVNTLARITGFQVSHGLHAKVSRLYRELSDQELAHTVRHLMATPSSHGAWHALVEEITVHETYFFRDAPQMELFWREVLPLLIAREMRRTRPRLRLWSAASSTGEETYTLAMMVLQSLLDVGEAAWAGDDDIRIDPRWEIAILGSDISRPVLDKAKTGIYLQAGSMGPIREFPPRFRPFMEFNLPPAAHGVTGPLPRARVKSCVRNLVRWQFHNLLAGTPSGPPFDVVFCRNVLVYFDESAKVQVQRQLHQALNPNGYLFLGPADVMLLREDFQAWRGEQAIYYQKAG